jgi:hypothetical protein
MQSTRVILRSAITGKDLMIRALAVFGKASFKSVQSEGRERALAGLSSIKYRNLSRI